MLWNIEPELSLKFPTLRMLFLCIMEHNVNMQIAKNERFLWVGNEKGSILTLTLEQSKYVVRAFR